MKRVFQWISNSGLIIAVVGVGILHAHITPFAYYVISIGVLLMFYQMGRLVFSKE